MFRKLRKDALERFCERVLDDVGWIHQDGARTNLDRYHAVFELLQHRNEELARAFDDPRRSTMLRQLGCMLAHGLIEPDELAQFSAETQDIATRLARPPHRDGGC